MKRAAKVVGLLACLIAGIALNSFVRNLIFGDNIVPDQPHRWVSSLSLQADSKALLVRKDNFFGVSSQQPLSGLRNIALGDEIEGVKIGAIKCFSHDRDEFYENEQYMWRGRWACQAGRSKYELDHSVQNNGSKNYDYIHVVPVNINN
jgi:hypothetical protein